MPIAAELRNRTSVPTVELDFGTHDFSELFGITAGGIGLLILSGLLVLETHVGDRTAAELLGAGDLLQPPVDGPDDLLEHSEHWRVLGPVQLALLDAEFAVRVRPWPQLVQALLRRAGRRLADIDAIRAVTAQPRLEVRLALLLWHLASRWGRVERTGIRLTLPLTHRLLGQLVSAERPSISHALHRLAAAGLVTGTTDDLHLHGSVEHHLAILIGRNGLTVEQLGASAVLR